MKAAAIIFSLISLSVVGQKAQFMNINQSLIALNPSFAGSNGLLRNQTSYRGGDEGNVSVFNATDVFLKPIKAGIGATCLYQNERNGLYQTWTGGLTYAQHISLYDGDVKLI